MIIFTAVGFLVLVVIVGYTQHELARVMNLILRMSKNIVALEREIKAVAQVEESRHVKTTGKIFKLFSDVDRLRNQSTGMRDRARKE